MSKKNLNATEREIQRTIIDYARAIAPHVTVVHYPAVGGPGIDNRRRSAIMKGDGVAAGFPDLIVLWQAGTPPRLETAYVEVKSAIGRLSPVQAAWRDHITGMGGRWGLVREPLEFANLLVEWQAIQPKKKPPFT